jgi:hypothetical protein
MTDLIDILPRTSTPLDRAAVQVVDSRSRFQADVHQIIDVRYAETIAVNLLPWLLRHWGLEDASAFMPDQQRLYKEGKRWQTARGRVGAYAIILDWLALDGAYEQGVHGDVRWGWFQLGLSGEPDRATLLNLIGLADLSKRASSVLGRIYGGYDIRPMRLDAMRLDGALLDDWSGVFLDGIAPKLSFGRQWGQTIEWGPSIIGGGVNIVGGTARFDEGFMLDRSALDQEVMEPLIIEAQAAFTTQTIDIAQDAPMPWPNEPWPNTTWNELPTFEIYGGPYDGTSS